MKRLNRFEAPGLALLTRTRSLERRHAPLERLGAPRSIGHMAKTGQFRRGEFQRVALIVVIRSPSSQNCMRMFYWRTY